MKKEKKGLIFFLSFPIKKNMAINQIKVENTTHDIYLNKMLTIQGNGIILTNGSFDGSANKTVNITPNAIGAASLSTNNTFAGNQYLANNKFLCGTDSAGATQSLLGISSSNNIIMGASAQANRNIYIYGKLKLNNSLPITEGGTGAKTASAARTNLGFTYGTTEPSGTSDTGDGSVYFKTGGDAVIDIGTDGIWTYRKWASGIAECWGNGQYSVNCTTAAGSLYYGSATVTLPSGLFNASTYSVSATCGTSTGSGWPVYGRTGSSTTSNFSAAFYNTASASGKVINVQMYVVGRWK